MKVKGAVVKSTHDFIKNKFPDKYTEWIAQLPKDSKKIFSEPIMSTEWYAAESSVIVPTRLASKMLFSNAQEGAWQAGRYSADVGLKGVYKVFVLLATPKFVIQRSTQVMVTMYKPAEMQIVELNKNSSILRAVQLPINNEIIEYRMAGWMERALEICGAKNISVSITKHLSQGDSYTEFQGSWS